MSVQSLSNFGFCRCYKLDSNLESEQSPPFSYLYFYKEYLKHLNFNISHTRIEKHNDPFQGGHVFVK